VTRRVSRFIWSTFITSITTTMASESNEQLQLYANGGSNSSSSSLFFVDVEDEVTIVPQKEETLSPPTTTASLDFAPSDIDSLSSHSDAVDSFSADDEKPIPHPVFYMNDGSVVFLVSAGRSCTCPMILITASRLRITFTRSTSSSFYETRRKSVAYLRSIPL
jgi:hypothetical protein